MASELTKTKRKRTAKRNIVLNNLLPSCENILQSEKSEDTLDEARVLQEALKEAAVEVKRLDEMVSDLTEDDAEFELNENESYKFILKTKKMDGKLTSLLSSKKEVVAAVAPTEVKIDRLGVKLPKIKIKTFDGDAMNWKAFIEAFDATIDIRVNISPIEKFTYLRGFLSGDALQTIQGMPLTQDNYKNAKDMLEKRYGNPQLIVSSHMNALLKLDKVVSTRAKELRELYNKVEINTRALRSSGISTEHFGALLIPVVLEKLPNIVRLQISRKLGSNNWSIEDFMESINDEITARENFEYLKKCGGTDEFEDVKDTPHTTTSLSIQQSKRVCIFCGNMNHFSDRCDIITDVNLRKQKIRELRFCYKCLKPNHIAKNCRKKIFCYKCKTQNKHHTAICDTELRSSSTNVTRSDKSVILQSASGYVTDETEKKFEEIKILLDNCSQQTFITDRVVKKLGLNPVAEVERKINAFGSEKGTNMKLKEYRLVLKPMDKSNSIYVKALAMPQICAPICRRLINSAIQQNNFLKTLKLADNMNNVSGNVDMLIGADVYWDIVSGNLKRNPSTGLVAISSSLGWLINGPVIGDYDKSTYNVNMATSHVLIMQSEKSEEKLLSEEIRKFWSLDLLGITENESLNTEDMGNITFEKGRYKIELPFIEGHPYLPDNLTLSMKRLEKLKERFDKNDDLKKQ